MAYPTAELALSHIHEADERVLRFVECWYDPTDSVLAHTSGSTGTPKEIRLLKSDMRASAAATCRFFNLEGGSTFVLPLSADYIAGMMMIVRAIESEGELFVEHPSRTTILSSDYKQAIDLLAIVPQQINALIESPKRHLVRNVIIGGAKTTLADVVRLRQAGVNAYATYGMTETCSHVALCRLTEDDNLFHALPGVTFSTDSESRLIIHAEHLSIKSLSTNDIVELATPTSFHWVGRYDNVVNSAGVKLHPEKIEQKLAPHLPGLTFYLTSAPSELWGEELVMLVESTSANKPINPDVILAKSKEILDSRHAPKRIVVMPRFERTSTGKIKRKRL